jgi:predicted lipoprotein with Yx(FWY)xxD motif
VTRMNIWHSKVLSPSRGSRGRSACKAMQSLSMTSRIRLVNRARSEHVNQAWAPTAFSGPQPPRTAARTRRGDRWRRSAPIDVTLEIRMLVDRAGLRGRRAFLSAAVAVGAVVAIAGCGSSSSSPTTSSSASSSSTSGAAQVSTGSVAGLGTVLVNAQGQTLYMFVPDKQSAVTCVGQCAAVWPPMQLPSGQSPVAAGGAKASLLGSDPNPAGGRAVTYAKWPLYTYTADTSAGMATGQALNASGGLWYVLSPSGAVIRTSP